MTESRITLGMDLEQFRLDRRLSYDDLAELIGVSQNRQAQAYALGETWPRTEQLQKIIEATKEAVTIHAMHLRRCSWLRANKPARKPTDIRVRTEGRSQAAR